MYLLAVVDARHPTRGKPMQRIAGARQALALILIAGVLTVAGLAAPAGASAVTSLTVLEREVLAAVNAERGVRGLAPVRAQADLTGAARAHALSMAHRAFVSHDSANGRSFSLRLLDHGYARSGFSGWVVGEDIASARAGTVAATPRGVVLLWMRSAPHRRVILGRTFRDAGVGVHGAGGERYFTLDLGHRRR
jgi:uncharacterized protein YkwD